VSAALASPGDGSPARLPRPLLWLGVPLAAVLLTGLFVFLGFPYERVREALASQLGAASGSQVQIAQLEPGLSLLGPVLVAQGVEARFPGGEAFALERARLRPAWSFAWVQGEPALAVDLRAPEGRMVGTVYAGGRPGFVGRLEEVELGRLPVERLLRDLALDGRASADIDLRQGPRGAEGRVVLDAREGSLGLPDLPMALPYQRLEGEIDLLPEGGVEIGRLSLEGPMLAVSGSGSVGSLDDPARATLDLLARVEVREASLRPMLRELGLRLDTEGSTEVRLGGTLARPVVRSAP